MNFSEKNASRFSQALEQAIHAYSSYFGERLAAVYVWGSVHRGEAVEGVSDLDIHAFTTETLDVAEREAFRQRFSHLSWISPPLPVHLVQPGLKDDADAVSRVRAFYVRLQYDATLVWGNPLFTKRDDLKPDRRFAQASFASVRESLRYAAGLDTENKSDFTFPLDSKERVRKIARVAVLGGGYLLMANDAFRSFKGIDTLPALQSRYPQWMPFLEQVEDQYITLTDLSEPQALARQEQTLLWLDWIQGQLHLATE